FIEKLVAAGNAYEADGDVYFSVATDAGYGRLSRQKVENMEPEEDSPLKRAPQDFALWKATKPGEDTAWDSPWGAGRPGWHIECSVMAEDAFGPGFEIHGGGLDLVFPHHENELAQSLALGHDFARIWMHNGLLTRGGEKMSKSLGNDMTIRGVTDTWGREVALMLLLSGQWRKPLDFNEGTLEQARAQLETFRNVFRSPSEPVGGWADLEAALDDDFNTPEALAVMHGGRDHELRRRAVRSESWLTDVERPRVQTKLERDLSETAGTRDHQGVLAWCEPFRYADAFELAAGESPLLACLDQVSDPRNLGAVIRSAEGAGASGVVVPAHGSARVTAAVCRSSAGAVEHLPVAVVPNLARYLAEIKRSDLWIAGAVGESGTPMWKADLSGGIAFVFGAEGKGLRPLVRRTCDLEVSIPQLGRVESLNVSVAAAILLYEARRQ